MHSYAPKLAAEQSVKRVRGIRAVANDIQVVLRSERTDPEVAKDAVHALRVHTNVPNRITVFLKANAIGNWRLVGVVSDLAAHRATQ